MKENDILTNYQRLCETKTADLLRRRLCEIIKRCEGVVDVYVRSYFIESFSPFWEPSPDYCKTDANNLVADVLNVFAKKMNLQKDALKQSISIWLSNFDYYENDTYYDKDYIRRSHSKSDFVHQVYYRKRDEKQEDDNPELMRIDAFRVKKALFDYNTRGVPVTTWPLYIMFEEALKEDELIYHKLFACSQIPWEKEYVQSLAGAIYGYDKESVPIPTKKYS